MVIQWTDFAWQMLSQTSDYILSEFGYKAFDSFLDSVDAGISAISLFPSSGKVEPSLARKPILYRSIVVNEHNKIVYFIDENNATIVISDFWDVRQEPITLVSSI